MSTPNGSSSWLMVVATLLSVLMITSINVSCLSSWTQKHGDFYMSNLIPDFTKVHSPWLLLNSPILNRLNVKVDTPSLIFANSNAGGKLLMVLDGNDQLLIGSINCTSGVFNIEKNLTSIYPGTTRAISTVSNALTALFNSQNNQYYFVRIDKNGIPVLFSYNILSNSLQSTNLNSGIKLIGGMVLSTSSSTLLISTNVGIFGISEVKLNNKFTISSSNSNLIGNVILIENENHDGFDIAYVSISYQIYQINVSQGKLVSTVSYYNDIPDPDNSYLHLGYMGISGYLSVLAYSISSHSYSLTSAAMDKQVVGQVLPLTSFSECSLPMGKLDMAIADRYFFKHAFICSNYTSEEKKGGIYFTSYSGGAARVGQTPKLGKPYINYQVQKDNIVLNGNLPYLGPLVSVSADHSIVLVSNQNNFQLIDYMNSAIVGTVTKGNSATNLPQFAFYSLGNSMLYYCTNDLNCQSIKISIITQQ